MCDDLIDNAWTVAAAESNIDMISGCLDLLYPPSSSSPTSLPVRVSNKQIEAALPGLSEPERGAFRLLSLLPIARPPLEELLDGFRTDLSFLAVSDAKGAATNGNGRGKSSIPAELPIKTDDDLLVYANNVASSVADLCVQLVWAHSTPYSHTPARTVPRDPILSEAENAHVLAAAREMGQALQLVNIARDVPADLKIGRVYLPGRALDTPVPELTADRRELLARANEMAAKSRGAIEKLPREARGGIRAACLVYLSIGDAVGKALDEGRVMERARVSKGARARKAWQAL